MLLSFGGGHPPAIILVPVVLVVWGLGHAGIWLVRFLVVKGRRLAVDAGLESVRWPWALVVAALGCSIVIMIGLVMSLSALFGQARLSGSWGFVVAAVFLLHLACFVTILLRRASARYLIGLAALVWTVQIGQEAVFRITRGNELDAGAVAPPLVAIVMLAALACHVLASARVQDFLFE